MLRLIFAVIALFIIAAAGFVLQRYDFPVTAQMRGYLIETSAARLAVILIVLFALTYAVLRIIFWFRNSPRRMLAKMRRENERNGYRNIMNGFSALAAGDTSRARKFAAKADKALAGQPLVKLLQAQVAVYSGEKVEAETHYKALTASDEGRFAGFRGLVSMSISAGQPEKALVIADDLLRDNPKSAWLNEALIDLAFRISDWAKLERYLKKAEANRALEKIVLKEKFAVYYFIKARIAREEGRSKDVEWLAERSLKYKPDFLPAALLLSDVYNENQDYAKTRKLIRRFWAISTHPIFMKNYEFALLNSGIREKSKRVRKLYEKNPNDAESIEFYARVLTEEQHNNEAREALRHGLSMRETKGLCLLMARLDDQLAWEAKAQKAFDDKCWHCRITGARYPDWQVYSDSGEFNTIIWDFPNQNSGLPKTALAHNDFLFIN